MAHGDVMALGETFWWCRSNMRVFLFPLPINDTDILATAKSCCLGVVFPAVALSRHRQTSRLLLCASVPELHVKDVEVAATFRCDTSASCNRRD